MRSHKGVYGPGSRSIVLCVIHKRAWYKSTYTILPQLKIDVFIVSTRNYSPSWRTIEQTNGAYIFSCNAVNIIMILAMRLGQNQKCNAKTFAKYETTRFEFQPRLLFYIDFSYNMYLDELHAPTPYLTRIVVNTSTIRSFSRPTNRVSF